MFIAALFIIARTWKQPRCPSADEWIRKQWYIYTMEYYSAIKKNTFESVLMRWMKLEPIIQSEVSQKEKHQYSILMHIYMEFRKMVMITLYVRQQKRHRCIEQSFGLCGRMWVLAVPFPIAMISTLFLDIIWLNFTFASSTLFCGGVGWTTAVSRTSPFVSITAILQPL